MQRQVPIPIEFGGVIYEEGFRADIVINKLVILELKSVEKTQPFHKKQILTYLKLSGLKLGANKGARKNKGARSECRVIKT